MKLTFAHAWILMLLWLVPAVGVWWYATARRRERNLALFVSGTLQPRLCPQRSAARLAWQAALFLAGLTVLIVAASRPRWGIREQMVYKRGRDVVIALDVSRSMLASDVYPNRLERAKVDLMDLIDDLDGDRAALLAFRHKAVLLCPLTTDYAYLRQALDTVDIDSAPRGETDIGDALNKALDAFETQDSSHKAIILISDGEDLTGGALEAAEQAGERGIPVFTVGLGNPRGARIPHEEHAGQFARFKGTEIVTKLDNETLDRIARASGGAYVPVATASTASTTLGELYRKRLSQILARDLEETLQRRHIERYQIFLLPAFLLMAATACLSRGRLAMVRRAPSDAAPGAPGERSAGALKDLTPPARDLKDISGKAAATALLLVASAAAFIGPGRARGQTTGAVPLLGGPPPQPAAVARDAATSTNAAAGPAVEIPAGRSGARMAQKLFRKGQYLEAAETYLKAAERSTRESQRDFMFNAAVAYYRAGNYERAASILQGLVQSSQTADTRAAEGLGAALYRQAGNLDDAVDAETLARREATLRQAAAAFQEALRQADESDDTGHNLALLLAALPPAEEKALIARLMQDHGETAPMELLTRMLGEQRRLLDAIPQAFTNDSPGQVAQLERLAAQQKTNANLWIPLKSKLMSVMGHANQEQLAALGSAMESTRDAMLDSASSLRDLDAAAYGLAATAEGNMYGMWKQFANYQEILSEDIRRQSNAVVETGQSIAALLPPGERALTDQAEVQQLTRMFLIRMPDPLPEEAAMLDDGMGPDAPPYPEGQKPSQQGLTAETHSNILDLAGQAMTAQDAALDLLQKGEQPAALGEQRKSLELLEEIKELLPRDPQQKPQPEKPPPQQQEPQPQPQEPPPEQQEQQQQEESPEEPPPEEDVAKLLERAREREQEYQDRQREQNRRMPLPPRERDW